MPELPEVEIVKRGLEPFVCGRKITAVELYRPDLRVPFPENLAETLTGCRIERLSRRAKYILFFIEGGAVMALHLGMSGRVLVVPPRKEYRLKKHDHMILVFDDGSRLVFNDPRRFGMVFLFDNEEARQIHKSFSVLGPEPLSNEFNGPVLAMALSGRRCSIKEALLNQKIVVGIGNIYACEALYEAGIDPTRKAGDVSSGEAEMLAAALKSVLRRAITAGGSTLRDYRHPDDNLGYFQHSFAVYGRVGEPCRKCGAAIRRIVQGGRSTFFCESCQK